MTDTYKPLAQQELTGGNDTLYTVPADTEAIIKCIRVVDNAGNGASVKIWQGGTGDDNLILPEVSLPAGGWGDCDDVLTLAAGNTIVATSDAASEVTVSIYGLEIS